MYAYGFRFYFTPLPGFFSPFPHGTGPLSVDYEYLALEDGPPIFKQDFSCPAPPVSLATTSGISVDFFSSSYLDVSVHWVRSFILWIQIKVTLARWVSPFGYLRFNVCLPTPRSFSQAATSFFACNRLGIHHMHLFACLHDADFQFPGTLVISL